MEPVIKGSGEFATLAEWFGFLATLAFMVMAIWDGGKAFRRGASRSLPKTSEPPEDDLVVSPEWENLCARAQRVIDLTLIELPIDVAVEAKQVPCVFKERAAKESAGYRRMGEYHNFVPKQKSDHNGPICLFLRSIEEWCAESGKDFNTEVRFVYLHELGHHFGWDEIDLVRHGLPSGKPPGEN